MSSTSSPPLALLKRNTKAGVSSWTFSDNDGIYTAESSAGKVIRCDSVEELRDLYVKFRRWGFKKPA